MDTLFARLAASGTLAQSFSSSYKFLLHGDDGGVWILTGGDTPELKAGAGPADCTVECSLETLAAILEADINPQVAYLENELRVAGDPAGLQQLVQLWQ